MTANDLITLSIDNRLIKQLTNYLIIANSPEVEHGLLDPFFATLDLDVVVILALQLQ